MSELSEEQKRKIEQEERTRLAEEAYRQELRRTLASSGPSTISPISEVHERRLGAYLPLILVATVILLSFGTWLFLIGRSARPKESVARIAPPAPMPVETWVPVTEQIVSGQFQVLAGSFRSWTIAVPTGTRNYRVTGHYSAIGGGGNDIEAVIATEDEFQNWINGHQGRVFYASPGRVTTGEIDIKGLPPGQYTLAFSNKFSLLTAKAVLAEISVNYERLK